MNRTRLTCADRRRGARGFFARDRAAGGCAADASSNGGRRGAGAAGRPGRRAGEVAGNRRRPARDLPSSGARRQRSGGVGRRQAAADAEGRTGRVERDERSDGAGRLHLLADRRRRLDERPVEPAGADVVRRVPEHVPGAGTGGLAPGAGRARAARLRVTRTIRPSPTTTATSSSTRRPATMRTGRSRIPSYIYCTVSATMRSGG